MTQQISALIDRWKSVVDRFTFESEEDKIRIMSWTGKSPLFWIESADEILFGRLCNLHAPNWTVKRMAEL